MVVSQVCPGAALEYWPGVVGARLVKNDIFTAKNTNVYWYGGGAGQNFQPVKISPRKALIIGVFPRLPGTLHMAGKLPTKYLFFFFSRPDPQSKKWTNYIQTCFWLELISFINSNLTTGWLAGDGTQSYFHWEAKTMVLLLSRVRQQHRSYLNVTKPDQTGCLQTALWKKNTKTVLGKYMQMQILCFYHGSMGFTFYILIVLSGAQFTCWR